MHHARPKVKHLAITDLDWHRWLQPQKIEWHRAKPLYTFTTKLCKSYNGKKASRLSTFKRYKKGSNWKELPYFKLRSETKRGTFSFCNLDTYDKQNHCWYDVAYLNSCPYVSCNIHDKNHTQNAEIVVGITNEARYIVTETTKLQMAIKHKHKVTSSNSALDKLGPLVQPLYGAPATCSKFSTASEGLFNQVGPNIGQLWNRLSKTYYLIFLSLSIWDEMKTWTNIFLHNHQVFSKCTLELKLR